MNLLDRIAYDSGGYTVQEILSSFCNKILEIVDLVNKNEEVCDEAEELLTLIKDELLPEEVKKIIEEMETDGTIEQLINIDKYNKLKEYINNALDTKVSLENSKEHILMTKFACDVNDANQAIKEYIEYCKANNLQEILIPEGTFIVDNIVIDYPITLRGTGSKSVLKLKNCATIGKVLTINSNNVTIKDLTIDGNKDNNLHSSGIVCEKPCSYTVIDNVLIENTTDKGLLIDGTDNKLNCITIRNNTGIGLDVWCSDSMFSNILCYYCHKNGIKINIGANKFNNIKVYLCNYNNTNEGAIMFADGITNIQMTNTEAQENFSHGIKLYNNKLISLINCVVDSNGITHAFGDNTPITVPRDESVPQKHGLAIAGSKNITAYINGNDFRWIASGGQYNQLSTVSVDDSSTDVSLIVNSMNNENSVLLNENKSVFCIVNGDIIQRKSSMVGIDTGTIGFYGTEPVTKPYITGSRGNNEALGRLLSALHNLGLITNDTTV